MNMFLLVLYLTFNSFAFAQDITGFEEKLNEELKYLENLDISPSEAQNEIISDEVSEEVSAINKKSEEIKNLETPKKFRRIPSR